MIALRGSALDHGLSRALIKSTGRNQSQYQYAAIFWKVDEIGVSANIQLCINYLAICHHALLL